MHQKGTLMYRKPRYLLASLFIAYCITGLAWGAADEGFYKGKTLRLIVAFAPGGGFDTYSRAIGRHLGKHIPGNPSIVVDNMTGAGGFIQANYMFQRAKPDGLTILASMPGTVSSRWMTPS